MNNFGVIEVASAKTTHAPGWAYVPDTGINPSVAALQPANRKRAGRSQPHLTLSDVSARQEAKIRKDLEALDRDNHKDVNIPIPARSGNRAQKKHTANVRKILQSQKTFANHLADFEALGESNPAPAAPVQPIVLAAPAAASASAKRGADSKRGAGSMAHKGSRAGKSAAAAKGEDADGDTAMHDAGAEAAPDTAEPPPPSSYPQMSSILPPYHRAPPAPHPGDADPLLESHVPPLPTDAELRAFMMAPPLSYVEARAAWTDEDRRYPVRVFCEVCGYWGRVRCLKCGARVCALDCLDLHREECVTRYGL